MTRKHRIPNMDVKRNSLVIGIPGDKFYRNPECTDGFYKMEGVLPGSTFYFEQEKKKFGRTLSRKTCPFYDTHDMNMKTLDPDKLWKNRVFKETIDTDSLYVKTISQWDKAFMKTITPVVNTKAKPVPVVNKKKAVAPVKKKN
jgi:hypothetical protein